MTLLLLWGCIGEEPFVEDTQAACSDPLSWTDYGVSVRELICMDEAACLEDADDAERQAYIDDCVATRLPMQTSAPCFDPCLANACVEAWAAMGRTCEGAGGLECAEFEATTFQCR
jgi:hypothetical protein